MSLAGVFIFIIYVFQCSRPFRNNLPTLQWTCYTHGNDLFPPGLGQWRETDREAGQWGHATREFQEALVKMRPKDAELGGQKVQSFAFLVEYAIFLWCLLTASVCQIMFFIARRRALANLFQYYPCARKKPAIGPPCKFPCSTVCTLLPPPKILRKGWTPLPRNTLLLYLGASYLSPFVCKQTCPSNIAQPKFPLQSSNLALWILRLVARNIMLFM